MISTGIPHPKPKSEDLYSVNASQIGNRNRSTPARKKATETDLNNGTQCPFSKEFSAKTGLLVIENNRHG